jgi:hypothetical protein
MPLSIMPLSIKTFGIMPLSIMTLGMPISIKTLSITKLGVMTFSIMGLIAFFIVMLNVVVSHSNHFCSVLDIVMGIMG